MTQVSALAADNAQIKAKEKLYLAAGESLDFLVDIINSDDNAFKELENKTKIEIALEILRISFLPK